MSSRHPGTCSKRDGQTVKWQPITEVSRLMDFDECQFSALLIWESFYVGKNKCSGIACGPSP